MIRVRQTVFVTNKVSARFKEPAPSKNGVLTNVWKEGDTVRNAVKKRKLEGLSGSETRERISWAIFSLDQSIPSSSRVD